MPSSSRSLRDSSPTFGMSRVISSGPSFVSRDSISCFSMWMLVNRSSLDEAIADDDRVLVVAALPGHERHQDVPPERELAHVGGARVGDGLVALDALADVHDRTLVDARALVAAHELLEAVLVELALVGLDRDPVGADAGDDAGPARDDDLAGVARGALLHAGADDRRLGLEERHRLALHVRAHQGAVGVVVLEERDERRRDRDDLLGRHVHVLDLVRRVPPGTCPGSATGSARRGSGPRRRAARSPARRDAPPPRRPGGTRSRW